MIAFVASAQSSDGRSAGSCGKEIIVTTPVPQYGTEYMDGFELVSESPIAIRRKNGTGYTTTIPNAGNAGDVQWRVGPPTIDVDEELEHESDRLADWDAKIASCSNLCCGDASGYCRAQRDNHKKIVQWLQCVAAARGGSDAVEADLLDLITPQVPGCPRYLRKSLVQWRQVGNPQLNTWEIRNVSDMTLKVSFREDGRNASPDTLPPGNSTQVGLVNRQVPPYVVRDFGELLAFNRTNGTNGKTLQCELAIRPRP